ncbi:SMKI09G0835 [Saccharomyces mikatae IFO 1815]|uniref:SMKI09G0835 protein n=1 Tax=Saccharomyces mikatae IFO 1815 TaxID=226126 RepID=A0AA35NIG9_SACMI|nr:uncharacterized protein SMKI_09G0835 [Saccharomyces mikatae IFO 1815]CAI4039676.1 SMKI09G0835 [Saccharomyces mikatae IFO 1815]
MEPSVAIDHDEISQSRYFVIVEKLSKIARIIYITDNFLIPSLYPLKEQYPKVDKIVYVQLTVDLVSIFIFITHEFLLLENGTYEKRYFERKSKRCSKFGCSRCNASAHHPKWFKVKHSLLCLGMFLFGVYSSIKVNNFFRTDQTVNLYRLLWLLCWQLSVIFSMKLSAFYGEQLDSHSVPLDGNDNFFGRVTTAARAV